MRIWWEGKESNGWGEDWRRTGFGDKDRGVEKNMWSETEVVIMGTEVPFYKLLANSTNTV